MAAVPRFVFTHVRRILGGDDQPNGGVGGPFQSGGVRLTSTPNAEHHLPAADQQHVRSIRSVGSAGARRGPGTET